MVQARVGSMPIMRAITSSVWAASSYFLAKRSLIYIWRAALSLSLALNAVCRAVGRVSWRSTFKLVTTAVSAAFIPTMRATTRL